MKASVDIIQKSERVPIYGSSGTEMSKYTFWNTQRTYRGKVWITVRFKEWLMM